jgi:mono/diheme cytochrome c family protein
VWAVGTTIGRITLGAVLGVVALASVSAAQPSDDAARGRELFAAKQCARCHLPVTQKGVGPPLETLRRPQGAYELAGRLWNHAPAMFTVLSHEGIPWPEIGAAEMVDLTAYLLADPRRDPAPDLAQGQVTLVKKGCLKCHRLRGEGGRAGPDFAELQATLAPATTWAAALWRHTPRMAMVALQQGVLYPRFSGDEMFQLIAYVRSAAGAR